MCAIGVRWRRCNQRNDGNGTRWLTSVAAGGATSKPFPSVEPPRQTRVFGGAQKCTITLVVV